MKHWSNEQFSAALLGEADVEAQQHLDECAACREELERARVALARMREEAAAGAAQPDMFWQRQRAEIHERMRAEAVPTRGIVWATAAAMAVLAASLLVLPSRRPEPVAAQDPDHLLLIEIQREVRRTVPRVLEPAMLLTQEMDRAVNAQDNP
jgi:hypothetical protein